MKLHRRTAIRLVSAVVVTAFLLSACGNIGTAPTDTLAPVDETAVVPVERTPEADPTTPDGQTVEEEPGMERYVNEAYGFSFEYPSDWELLEGTGFVTLNRGTLSLVVGYRHMTEDPNICCPARLPEGELVEAGVVTCAGEELERDVLQCDGDTKAVLYHGNVQVQVDRVIGSLRTFPPDKDFAAEAPEAPTPTDPPPTPEPTDTPTVEPSPSPTPPPATASTAVAVAQRGGANVRSGPGTDYGLAGFLDGGEQVEIIGRHNDWWQVSYQGRRSWIYDGVVSVSEASQVPVVDAVPTRVSPSPSVIPTAAPPSMINEARWIDVDLSSQRLTAYENGEALRTTLVSTGLPRTPTVQGQFRIWIKLRYDDMEGPGYHLEDVPYVMYFYQGYGIHGTYWHSNFGQRMSHGCVNLETSEAEWLFNFADVGTLVNVRQ